MPEPIALARPNLTQAEIDSGEFHPDVRFATEGKGRKTWPDKKFDKGDNTGANWDDFLQETYRPKGWPEGAEPRDVARSYREFDHIIDSPALKNASHHHQVRIAGVGATADDHLADR